MSARRITGILVGLGLLGYLATGLVVIPQDEIGVVRRFGAVVGESWPPGLHWGLPRGIDRVDRLARDRARAVTVGVPGIQDAPLGRAPDSSSDDFLTGDLNLVTAQALIQFRVVRPVDYLFASRSADAAVEALGESALARALAGHSIDDILTGGRAEVVERVRREVQSGADALGLGISVRAVRLARIAPPALVAPAFADVARARSESRQAVTRAREYRDLALAGARGLARETADRASGRHDSLVQSARGEADRFSRLAAEVARNPGPARRRLYLETVAEVLPNLSRKFVVAPGRDVDLSLIGEK